MSPENTEKQPEDIDGQEDTASPDPEVVEKVKNRIDHMFAAHEKDPLMIKIRDISVQFAEEGKIVG